VATVPGSIPATIAVTGASSAVRHGHDDSSKSYLKVTGTTTAKVVAA